MARAIHKLSARQVATLTEPGRYGDCNGLYLAISPTGSKSWIFRYLFGGREREMGCGPVAAVSLAEAREKAKAARAMLASGRDPIDHREARPAVPTFGEIAAQ